MALDRNAFIDHFLDEAAENLIAIETGILALKQDPGNTSELTVLLRELHTLKGSAGSVGFDAVARAAHELEELCTEIRRGQLLAHRAPPENPKTSTRCSAVKISSP